MGRGEPSTEPSAEEIERVLAHLLALANEDRTAYWVAWKDESFFAVEASYPDDALILRGQALIPIAIDLDVRRVARWFVAHGDMVLDLR
jgi:hypothetical protein